MSITTKTNFDVVKIQIKLLTETYNEMIYVPASFNDGDVEFYLTDLFNSNYHWDGNRTSYKNEGESYDQLDSK